MLLFMLCSIFTKLVCIIGADNIKNNFTIFFLKMINEIKNAGVNLYSITIIYLLLLFYVKSEYKLSIPFVIIKNPQ